MDSFAADRYRKLYRVDFLGSTVKNLRVQCLDFDEELFALLALFKADTRKEVFYGDAGCAITHAV